jgi:ABC-type molybdate transport system permease subunit
MNRGRSWLLVLALLLLLLSMAKRAGILVLPLMRLALILAPFILGFLLLMRIFGRRRP